MENKEKKDYELSFLIKAPGDEARIFEIIRKYRGDIYNESSIDNIILSYPIKKQTSALFGFCHFTVQTEDISKINQELKLLDSTLRFLLIRRPLRNIGNQIAPEEPPEKKRDDSSAPTSLTNEALEQKLEEILS